MTFARPKNRTKQEKLRLGELLKRGEIDSAQNEKLLNEIKESLTVEKEIDLEFLFKTTEPVFADWVSGTIRVPIGKMIKYIHMGYESVYQNDMFLLFCAKDTQNQDELINSIIFC